MVKDLLDRRFLVVTGKGGTGKTTLSGALALLAASRGKRVLVTMSQSKERLSGMLETEYIGSSIQRILPGIDAVNMDPETCIDEYGMMVLKVKAIYKAIFDNQLVKGFLRAVPGMDAWSMLGKALFHTKEKDESGRPRYDLVILDAPATGHGLQMLRVPLVIQDVAPPGLLRREADEGVAILRDPKASGIVVVTLPEEMPTAETEELVGKIQTDLRMPVAGLVVNQVLHGLFDKRYDAGLRAADVLEQIDAFAPIGKATRTRVSRERIQKQMLERLAKLELPRMTFPALAVERVRRTHVDGFAKALALAGM